MSIRATVGTILPPGLLQAIYVESGGLPSELGAVLQRNIKVQAQVEELRRYLSNCRLHAGMNGVTWGEKFRF